MFQSCYSPYQHWDTGISSPGKSGISFDLLDDEPKISDKDIDSLINYSTSYFSSYEINPSQVRTRLQTGTGADPISLINSKFADFRFSVGQVSSKEVPLAQHFAYLGMMLRTGKYNLILKYLQDNEQILSSLTICKLIGYLSAIFTKNYSKEFHYYLELNKQLFSPPDSPTHFYHYFHLMDELNAYNGKIVKISSLNLSDLLMSILLSPNNSFQVFLTKRRFLYPVFGAISQHRIQNHSFNLLSELDNKYEAAMKEIPPLLPVEETNAISVRHLQQMAIFSKFQKGEVEIKLEPLNTPSPRKGKSRKKQNKLSQPIENSIENNNKKEMPKTISEMIDAKMFNEAILKATEELDHSPKDEKLYIQRAISFRKINMIQSAIIDATHAIKLNQKCKEAWKLRASLWLMIEEVQFAVNDLMMVIDPSILENEIHHRNSGKKFNDLPLMDKLELLTYLSSCST